MNWSEYQLQAIEQYTTTNTNLCLEARPGSAKTTTLLKLLQLKLPQQQAVFVSFSNTIVDELKHRIPTSIQAMTVHGAGMRAIMRHYHNSVQVDESKFFREALAILSKNDIKSMSYAKKVSILVQYIYVHNITSVDQLLSECDDEQADDLMCEFAWKIHQKCLREAKSYKPNAKNKLKIDFSEMVYWPATRKEIIVQKYDEVFIDEAQDNSIVQQMLIDRMVKKQGRFIACGDPYQSIYSFLGADVNAFNNFRTKPNTVTIQLPISYRLPKIGVEFVNDIFGPAIQCWDKAIEGEINEDGSVFEAQDGDFVLCRNNKPLFELYINMLKNGIKSYIRDKELGDQLIELTGTIKHLTFESAQASLQVQLDVLAAKLSKTTQRPTNHKKYISLSEKISIVNFLAKHYNSYADVYDILDWMFNHCDYKGVVLMTYHKSKGLETDNVYIIRQHLCPSKFAITEQDYESEKRVKFVAYTRFKKKMVFDNNF